MTAVQLLRVQADFAFAEFKGAIEKATESEAWARLPSADDDYLHTDGSLQGIVLHVAGCKVIYGSVAFRNSEVRWRDVADRMDQFEPSWSGALAYLDEAHAYWMDSWAGLSDEDLTREFLHFRGKLWPAWRIVNMAIHHDSYHGGQLAVIRYATVGASVPPPTSASDIRNCCRELPSW